jgi:glycerophosphoryl diester phosphodiesterase
LSLFAPLDAIFAPAPDPARVAFLYKQPFAHRGLHGLGLIENSRAAFDAALAMGRGFECDVQASADGVPFIFHDYELDRLTGESGPVAARTAAELDRVTLTGADESVPRLAEILARVKGRTPILIEIKSKERNIQALCLGVAQALQGYDGKAAIMSFNPLVPGWFASHARHVVRGLVVSEEGKRGVKGALERTCALWKAKAEFLAYDVRDLPSTFAARARARGLPVLTWTVRSKAQKQVAAEQADQIIYEKQG